MDRVNRAAVDVSALLHAWSRGDVEARDRVMEIVYEELRKRAAAHLRRERAGYTLQPTALVHETYLHLVNQNAAAWQNRAQFFGVASEIMRRILVDRARARKAAKRSGQWARVSLDESLAQHPAHAVDVLDLDGALTELASLDARQSRIAELKFFGGLTIEQTAQVLGLSAATVGREWQLARAWLYARLKDQGSRRGT